MCLRIPFMRSVNCYIILCNFFLSVHSPIKIFYQYSLILLPFSVVRLIFSLHFSLSSNFRILLRLKSMLITNRSRSLRFSCILKFRLSIIKWIRFLTILPVVSDSRGDRCQFCNKIPKLLDLTCDKLEHKSELHLDLYYLLEVSTTLCYLIGCSL